MCMYLAASLEWLLNLTKKKKKFAGKKLYKGQGRNVTAGNLIIILLKKIGCWNLESPGKKLAVGKKCDRWKLGITPKSEKKLTVERNNKESLKK